MKNTVIRSSGKPKGKPAKNAIPGVSSSLKPGKPRLGYSYAGNVFAKKDPPTDAGTE